MVKMIPPGKKSDPVDVLPHHVGTMERKGWTREDAKQSTTKPVKTKIEKVTDDGES